MLHCAPPSPWVHVGSIAEAWRHVVVAGRRLWAARLQQWTPLPSIPCWSMKTLRFFLTLRLLFVQGWRSGSTAGGSPAGRLGIERPIQVWSAMQPSNTAPLRFGGWPAHYMLQELRHARRMSVPPGYDGHGGQNLDPCSDRRPAASGKPTGSQDGNSVCRHRWL